MPDLYFVTSNQGKIDEAQAILGFPIKIAKIEVDEIQDLNVERVAYKKAQNAFAILKKPLLVDDVSLEVIAWKGFPGPFIKHIREAGGNELLLQMIKFEKDRRVIVKAAVGYHDGKKVHVFLGSVNGVLAKKYKGTRGWGFDPLIIIDGTSKTFAEMSEEEKNAVSHRRRALDKLKTFLQNTP